MGRGGLLAFLLPSRTNPLRYSVRALTTANGRHLYDLYHKLAEEAHEYLSMSEGKRVVNFRNFVPGHFGYDSMVTSVAWVALTKRTLAELNLAEREITVEEAADLVHQGWTENYLYWRDQEPFLQARGYGRPRTGTLGDPDRDRRAASTFAELSPDEQETDRVLARFLLKRLCEADLAPSLYSPLC